MPKQKGIIKLEGTMDDVTFYKTRDGYLAKTKSGVSASRINTDPRFARTRENMHEFTSAAKSGKHLREAAHALMQTASDSRVISRLQKTMSAIEKLDTTSVRGERNVGVAIAAPSAKALLKGFEFNDRSQIGSILFKPYTVTTLTGVIKIVGLVPINDIAPPPHATHLTLRGAYAVVNFVNGTNEIQFTNEVNLPIDATATTVTLTPAAVPSLVGTKIYLLQIEFFQQVNAVQYILNDGIFNALVIAEVA